MSAAQSTAVHDGLLHPHLKVNCLSAAAAVRRLPPVVRTSTPAFDVRSSGLFRGRSGGLQLITRIPDSFRRGLKTLLFFVLLAWAYTAHSRLCDYALCKIQFTSDIDIMGRLVHTVASDVKLCRQQIIFTTNRRLRQSETLIEGQQADTRLLHWYH